MKFCKHCGSPIDENAIFCSRCGARVNADGPRVNYNPFGGFGGYGGYYPVYDERGSMFMAVLSFLFREIGLVVWFMWRHTHPGKARSAAKGALSSVSVSMPILGAILWMVWRDEEDKRDYAKVCGISAIIGAVIYVLAIVGMIVLYLTGAVETGYYTSFPMGDMAAFMTYFR